VDGAGVAIRVEGRGESVSWREIGAAARTQTAGRAICLGTVKSTRREARNGGSSAVEPQGQGVGKNEARVISGCKICGSAATG
jgi:hypothetical protein